MLYNFSLLNALLSSITFATLTIAEDVKQLKVSIYPPPVADDYSYQVTIYCNSSDRCEGVDGPTVKLIAEQTLLGKMLAQQNVMEGQFENDEQNNDNASAGSTVKNRSQDIVERKKADYTIKCPLNERLKQCANNEVFIKIVKILAVGPARNNEEKLLTLKTMTIAQFEGTKQFMFDFEKEYRKTFKIVSHMHNKLYEFTVRFKKVSGANNQGFLLQQNFVVYHKELRGHTVDVTVPITKAHKISERRGDIEIKINYKKNDHGDGQKDETIVKMYSIDEKVWNEFETFFIDLNEQKVRQTNPK
uniref:Signal peptide-containing protein n=1 Tax=Globodera pallida TaxID=36090 RepID=A0A183CET2_GLOPA